MKKNFTVNISGIIFHIDEDAYNKLNKYLENLKRHFSNSEGGDEIIQDIEMRIAEKLNERNDESKKLITIDDISAVIKMMGEPSEFETEEETTSPPPPPPSGYKKRPRRLFRNPDHKVIGGVCGGIGSYFNFDPIWLRIVFIVGFFVFGSGPLIYIILWIVMPEARTTAEKLEMKGEKVNVSNIEKKIRDEASKIGDTFNELKNDAKETFYSAKKKFPQSSIEKILEFFIILLKYAIKAFVIFIGIILIIIGVSIIIGLIAAFFSHDLMVINGSGMNASDYSVRAFLNSITNSPEEITLSFIGVTLLIAIPLLMLIYNGIKLLFSLKFRARYLGLTAFSLWLIGLMTCGIMAFKLLNNFSDKASNIKNCQIVQPINDCLYLDAKTEKDILYYSDDPESQGNTTFGEWNINSSETGFYVGKPSFDFVKSESKNYEMLIYTFSRGKTFQDADKKSRRITFNYLQTDSTIVFDQYMKLLISESWRNQKLKVIVKVPIGKSIHLSGNMAKSSRCIKMSKNNGSYDFYENTCSYYYLKDVVNKKYTMTENGLVCTSSAEIPSDTLKDESNSDLISMNLNVPPFLIL